MKENDTKRMNDMKTIMKSILPLLIVVVSIFTGMVLVNGENIANVTNVTNVTMGPNVTIPIPTPAIAPNVTIGPNVTIPIPTPAIAPNVTIGPNVTIPISTSTPIPVVPPSATVKQDTMIVSTPVIYENTTRGTVFNTVPTTPIPIHTSKKKSGSTQTVVPTQTIVPTQAATPIIITVTSANNSNRNDFLGDIYDKIIIAAILGFIGLLYEIIKIRYENKQKAKQEQINEDTQNKLLEKLERRQEKLLAQHGMPNKKQDEPLGDSEKRREDINDQNKNV